MSVSSGGMRREGVALVGIRAAPWCVVAPTHTHTHAGDRKGLDGKRGKVTGEGKTEKDLKIMCERLILDVVLSIKCLFS